VDTTIRRLFTYAARMTRWRVLAEHDDVEAIWYSGSDEGVKMVEMASASNMKRTWCPSPGTDWFDDEAGEGREYLRESVLVKNIWIPYGAK
jgi:aldehyde dehydrogenase (NAD+)